MTCVQREQREMEEAIQRSLEESHARAAVSARHAVQGDYAHAGPDSGSLMELDNEIVDVEMQIKRLQELLKTLRKQRDQVVQSIRAETSAASTSKGKGKQRDPGTIDYHRTEFEWSGALHEKLKSVFGFNGFRLCQEG